jgi:hypothetical protein
MVGVVSLVTQSTAIFSRFVIEVAVYYLLWCTRRTYIRIGSKMGLDEYVIIIIVIEMGKDHLILRVGLI